MLSLLNWDGISRVIYGEYITLDGSQEGIEVSTRIMNPRPTRPDEVGVEAVDLEVVDRPGILQPGRRGDLQPAAGRTEDLVARLELSGGRPALAVDPEGMLAGGRQRVGRRLRSDDKLFVLVLPVCVHELAQYLTRRDPITPGEV